MKKEFSVLPLLAVLAVVLLILPSCKQNNAKLEYGLSLDQTLRVNLATEPPTLDWNKATDTTSAFIQENIMDGLIGYSFDEGKVGLKPALALEWSSTEENRIWTFKLRKDVKWSDGQPFEPYQVLDGWKRLLDPLTASEYAYFLYGIKNAKAFNEGTLEDFSKVGIKVEGHQIRVELEKPMSYFPYLLTHHSTYPVRVDVVNKFGDSWTEPGNLISLGAYNLKVWDHDKAVVLERNPSYYGEPAKTQNILAYMIEEPSTAINLFDSGRLDILLTLPAGELAALKKRPEYRESPILSLYYYGFNVNKAPTDNLLVRKAIAMAIDKKEITKMLNGGQQPLSGWLPVGLSDHSGEVGLPYDVKKAKELLAQAGFADKEIPKVEISFNSNEDHKRVAENVQAQLKTKLGINVELKNEEWKVYLGTLSTNPSPMYRMGWVADYPDPDNFLNLMTSESENNHTGWVNEKFDKLIKKAVSLSEKQARKDIYTQAQKILIEEDVAVVPLFSSVSHLFVNKRIKNFPVNVMSRFDLKDVVVQ